MHDSTMNGLQAGNKNRTRETAPQQAPTRHDTASKRNHCEQRDRETALWSREDRRHMGTQATAARYSDQFVTTQQKSTTARTESTTVKKLHNTRNNHCALVFDGELASVDAAEVQDVCMRGRKITA
jgi:hypothetical protein